MGSNTKGAWVNQMAVTVKLDVRKQLTLLNSPKAQKRIGSKLIREVKSFILKGISPVMGYRRFVAYKNPGRYPAGRKPSRPVNLKLEGDMLNALDFRVRSGSAFEFGWFDREQAIKANNHNTGDTVPERRLLPTKEGEEFNVSITRKLRDLYARELGDILKSSK